MKIIRIPASGKSRSRGISLIIVLIMLVIIGVTAATAMRSATSEQRATNNLRMEGLAQQYADAALRYCEGELQKPDASRNPKLKSANISTTTFAVSGWEQTVTWVGTGGISATKTTVPDAWIGTSGVTVLPTTRPECVAETQTTGSPTFTVTVVTARGFSPDYAADANGNTTNGAVVWLQSILNL
jgi:type IV pilus assembly protein PilX